MDPITIEGEVQITKDTNGNKTNVKHWKKRYTNTFNWVSIYNINYVMVFTVIAWHVIITQ